MASTFFLPLSNFSVVSDRRQLGKLWGLVNRGAKSGRKSTSDHLPSWCCMFIHSQAAEMSWDGQSSYLSIFPHMTLKIILSVTNTKVTWALHFKVVDLLGTYKPYVYSLETGPFYDFFKGQFIHEFSSYTEFIWNILEYLTVNVVYLCEKL
jgi:hypothetical protein